MTPNDVEVMIHEEGCSTETYFKRAMKWKYGQYHDTYLDVVKFDIHYIVPDYVIAYTTHLYHSKRQRAIDETTCDDIYLADVQGRGD